MNRDGSAAPLTLCAAEDLVREYHRAPATCSGSLNTMGRDSISLTLTPCPDGEDVERQARASGLTQQSRHKDMSCIREAGGREVGEDMSCMPLPPALHPLAGCG